MGRKPLAVILVGLMILTAFLGGCRRSAAPPIGELTPEEEATAAMQEAQENSDQGGESLSPLTTVAPSDEATPMATEEPTLEPTVEPTATTAPTVDQAPATEETAEPTPAPTAEVTSGGPTTYVVQPGDNLFRIALKYNLSPEALAQANNITNPGLISVGQTLTIPAGGSTSPTTPPSVPTGCQTVYVVQPGDNLFRIALRYNFSQYYLAQVNNIPNPSVVYVGQQICIP